MTGETTYTRENLTEFYRIAAMRMGTRRYQAFRLLYVLGGAALLLIGGYEALAVFGGEGDIVVILLAGLGLYLGAQLLQSGIRFYASFAARALRSIPEDARRCRFSFEEDQLVVSNRVQTVSYDYEQFGVIYETARGFYFYINAYNGYVLEKSGLRGGTADELRAFLNSRREDAVQDAQLA